MGDWRTLGKYQLIAELARGGMGVVYLGITSGLGGFSKLLVIKELKPELVDDGSFLEMFLEEARLAARLNHPNIVPTFEVGIDDNRPFIVMAYLDGQTLARVLRKKPEGFTLQMHLAIIREALEGLQYAHAQKDFDGTTTSVVHRDISPQNVFVTYDGQVKVVDFGIAKASDTTVETRAGVFKGKPAYMAPEQLHGDVDPRADVFAVGVMLWEAVAQRRMWPKKSDVEIMSSLISRTLPSIDEAAPDAPEVLKAIVRKAVSVDILARYQSAQALREDIDAYLASVDDRTTMKAIGAVIGLSFEQQRQELQQIIERCIAVSKSQNPPSSRSKLPSIYPSDESGPNSQSPPFTTKSAIPSVREMNTNTTGKTPASLRTPAAAAFDTLHSSKQRTRMSSPLVFGVGGMTLAAIVITLVAFKNCDGRKSDSSLVAAGSTPNPISAPSVIPSVNPPTSVSAPAPPVMSTATVVMRPTPPTRPTPYYRPPTPTPTPRSDAVPPAGPAPNPKTDCNPPFYYDGTKKVFKPGCL